MSKKQQTAFCVKQGLGKPMDWITVLPDSRATTISPCPVVHVPLAKKAALEKKLSKHGRQFVDPLCNYYPWSYRKGCDIKAVGYLRKAV